jgi:hypothetical protein
MAVVVMELAMFWVESIRTITALSFVWAGKHLIACLITQRALALLLFLCKYRVRMAMPNMHLFGMHIKELYLPRLISREISVNLLSCKDVSLSAGNIFQLLNGSHSCFPILF